MDLTLILIQTVKEKNHLWKRKSELDFYVRNIFNHFIGYVKNPYLLEIHNETFMGKMTKFTIIWEVKLGN